MSLGEWFPTFQRNIVPSPSESRNPRRMSWTFLNYITCLKIRALPLFKYVSSHSPHWHSITFQKTWILNNIAINSSNLWSEYCLSISEYFKLDLVRHLYASIFWLYAVTSIIHQLYQSEKLGVWLPSRQEILPASDHSNNVWGPPSILLDSTVLNGLVAWSWLGSYSPKVKNMWSFITASRHVIMAWWILQHRNITFPFTSSMC